MKKEIKRDKLSLVVSLAEGLVFPLIATATIFSLPDTSLSNIAPSFIVLNILLAVLMILTFNGSCQKIINNNLSKAEDEEMASLIKIRDMVSKGEVVTSEIITNSLELSNKADECHLQFVGQKRVLEVAAKKIA